MSLEATHAERDDMIEENHTVDLQLKACRLERTMLELDDVFLCWWKLQIEWFRRPY